MSKTIEQLTDECCAEIGSFKHKRIIRESICEAIDMCRTYMYHDTQCTKPHGGKCSCGYSEFSKQLEGEL